MTLLASNATKAANEYSVNYNTVTPLAQYPCTHGLGLRSDAHILPQKHPGHLIMLCQVCIDAIHWRKGWVRNDRDAIDPHILLAHHGSVGSLESSARNACEVCYPF